MNQLDLPGFGFVGITLDSHHVEPAVPVCDPLLDHKPLRHLPNLSLLVRCNGFQRLTVFGIGPGFNFDKYQHLILLGNDINLPGFVTIVFFDDPVPFFFEKLDCRFLPSLPKCKRS